MKRRVISFISVLALCMSLCPTQALAACREPGTGLSETAHAPALIAAGVGSPGSYEIGKDTAVKGTISVVSPMEYKLNGYSYTCSAATVLRVENHGTLYLRTGGTIGSGNGAGVEVAAGGALYVEAQGITLDGTTYGLDISSGAAEVKLFGGTFKGGTAAIHAEDYCVLREVGFAFFDENGTPIQLYGGFDGNGDPVPLTSVGEKKVVTVKECTDHSYIYEPDDGPTHSGNCKYCWKKTAAPEKCTFSFDNSGYAECDDCGRAIKIGINIEEDDLVYNGTPRPDSVTVKVILDEDTSLSEGDDYDYTVELIPGENAGDRITVTVCGKSYNGTYTDTGTFSVTKDTPDISWKDLTEPVSVSYQVDKDALKSEVRGRLLERINIAIHATGDTKEKLIEELKEGIRFSYKKQDETEFTDGLPAEAGTYEIIARLPAQTNYKAAETGKPLKLTVNKIDPIIEAPKAIANLVYDRAGQKLVTPGTVLEGAVILFALGGSTAPDDSAYSEAIPVGTNAGTYFVWYKVEGTNNYNEATVKEPITVTIARKTITPDVKLEYTSCVYDGGKKEPTVTVVDPTDNNWVVPSTEYKVEYDNNQNVSTEEKPATVTVKDSGSGNYNITTVKREFRITAADQAALTITKTPDKVTYGDVFTLGTTGGSGSGTVTWTIIDGSGTEVESTAIAKINTQSGQVTVTGVGKVTVRATKSGSDSGGGNHSDATAEWTFTADPKHVTAVVTADSRPYKDSDLSAAVHAEVPARDVMFSDKIEITGLTGTFGSDKAGWGKTVTVVIDEAKIKVNNGAEIPFDKGNMCFDTGNYIITFSAAPVTADITPKPVEAKVTVTADENFSYLYDGKPKEPGVTVTYKENDEGNESEETETTIPATEYTVTYRNNTDVGTAAVIVTARADGNYTFTNGPVTETFEIKKGKSAELTSKPQVIDLTYNGAMQNLVTAGTATGGQLVYALKGTGGEPTDTDYLPTIPQGKDAGTYTVYFKVKGDSNHGDTAPESVEVTIKPKTVTDPVIKLEYTSVGYDGGTKTPRVTQVIDDGKDILPEFGSAYTVTYSNNTNAGTATVHFNATVKNYIVSGSTTFEITKAKAAFAEDGEPQMIQGLFYKNKPLELVTPGIAKDAPEGGTVVYSLNGGAYSAAIPAATECGTYTVRTKVQGNTNYEDSDVKTIEVTIGVNKVDEPTVELSSTSFRYNGSEQKPTITVKDDDGDVIPANEYTVTYRRDTDGSDDADEHTGPEVTEKGLAGPESVKPIDAGTYKITIENKAGGNYEFQAESRFTITPADQTPLIITGKPDIVRYGDTIQLGTTGGSGNGTVTWSIVAGESMIDEETKTSFSTTGQLRITGAGGSVTVKATRKSDTGEYADVTDTWTFYVYPKPVTPVVTVKDKDYDGTTEAKLTATWKSGDMVGSDMLVITLKGAFDTPAVGANKQVSITSKGVGTTSGTNRGNYEITYPDNLTGSIYRVDAKLETVPAAQTGLSYTGNKLELITGGTTRNGIGTLEYSLEEKGVYSAAIPTAINAGTYTVWYRVADSVNWAGIGPVSVSVAIKKATPIIEWPTASPIYPRQPLSKSELTGGKATFNGEVVSGSFAWKDDSIIYEEGQSYEVVFTPDNAANYESVISLIKIGGSGSIDWGSTGSTNDNVTTPSTTEPGTETAATQTTVRGGTASTVVSDAAGAKLADEAVANQSKNVVIKPEITGGGNVTKTEVSIPASAVGRISSETNAALTVSTPIADVTIPNAALDTLSGAGGTVSIVTEQVENTVVLTLTAGGKDVGNLPGGLTLTVPVEDAGPGMVAVLVYEDGTRETVRKSVAEDGGVRIPLNGSATVEIVDNSKSFVDVPAENWAADAVAFASAHELFNGTSETTFSPELSMSRAMLATVLYNLEGRPDRSMTGVGFSDVNGGAWYTEGILWAAENGIVGGYGNGEFGPNDKITREQLAVMLWRYMGSPEADDPTLNFTDADQVSSYAEEALCWATANGILSGPGGGRLDPGGVMTRAHAAQLLKNFLEKT